MKHQTTIPGIAARHAIITPTCIENRSEDGAWNEAVRQLRVEYDACLKGWEGQPLKPKYHLVLVVERPGDRG